MNPTHWGLLGAGWIASKAIAPAMHAASGTALQAVASRDLERSHSLNPITVHQSYEALLQDPDVDAVYISLPNHLHCEWTVKALEAGKHVLCEKPFAMNVAEVERMVETAGRCDRLLVDAVWSRWHPRMERLVEYIQGGELGEIVSINSSFTFPASLEGNYRLDPEMGGGALFDVGVYSLHAVAALLGDNQSAVIEKCEANIGPTGIDLTTRWRLRVGETSLAEGVASFEEPENQSLFVQGKNGSAELLGDQAFTSWKATSALRLGNAVEEFAAVDPYQLMIENFGKSVRGEVGWVLPLSTSLWVAKVVDQLRVEVNSLR